MCERKYSEEHCDVAEGFCSESCRHVYVHLYEANDLLTGQAARSGA